MDSWGLTVKALSDDSLLLEGYGIVWNHVDADGEYFSQETDLFEPFWSSKIPVLLEHGRVKDVGSQALGHVVEAVKDDFGLRVKMKLDNLTHELRQWVLDNVEAGTLGLSSGTASSMMERVGNWIRRWFPAEISLTTNPAEKLTLGVSSAKAAPLIQERIDEITLALQTERALTMMESIPTRDAGCALLDICELEEELFAERKAKRLADETAAAHRTAALRQRVRELTSELQAYGVMQ